MSDIDQTDSESDDDIETSINIHENSDSEATESESSDDEDAKNIQSFVDCLSKIEQNKYNYDSYVELLGLAQWVSVLVNIFIDNLK